MEPEVQAPAPEVTPPPAAPPEAPVKSELQLFREKKAAAEPPKEPAAPAPPVVEPPKEPAAVVEPPAPPPEHEWVDPDTKERVDLRTKAGRRIKDLKGIIKSSEVRILELQSQLAARSSAEPPKAPVTEPTGDTTDPEPQLDQFADQADPYLAYTRSLARWEARQEHKAFEEKRTAADRVQQQQTQRSDLQAKWDAKLPETTQRHPDFPETWDAFYDSLAPFAQPQVINGETKPGRHRYLINRLLQSPDGQEIAYFLGKHPEEVPKLFAARSFDEHVLAIGRLEERVLAQPKTGPSTPPLPPAPPPMAPVGAAATVTTYNPETATLAQFRAHKKALFGR